jgi:hypothetical protein
VAEILSNSLVLTVASLAARNIDATAFPWIEQPDPVALSSAHQDLTFLGAFRALDDPSAGTGSKLELSPIGQLINQLQIDAALAVLVYRGCELGLGEVAVTLAGLFSVASNVFWRGSGDQEKILARAAHKKLMHPRGDAVTLYFVYLAWLSACNSVSESVAGAEDGALQNARGAEGGGDDEDVSEITQLLSAVALATRSERSAMADFLGTLSGPTADHESDADEESSADEMKGDADARSIVSGTEASELESVAETEMETASVGTAAEEREERQRAVKVNRAAAKLWCKDNFINAKSMGIAQSLMRDITKEIKALPMWKDRPSQAAPTAVTNAEKDAFVESLRKLVASSMFLNAAVQTSDRGEYYILKNEVPTVAFVHPGSALTQLRDDIAPPSWLVFHTLFQSTKPFLSTVTPIKREWIEECAPLFYAAVHQQVTHGIRGERISVHIASSLHRSIFGRRLEKVQLLEEELARGGMKCSLQLNCESSELIAWCSTGSCAEVRRIVEERVTAARRKICQQVAEETVLGGTRAVFGQGGVVEHLLFGEDYISVLIGNLPPETTEGALAQLASLAGRVNVREATILNDGKNSGAVHGDVLGKVIYHSVADAVLALTALNGELVGERGNKICVSPCRPDSVTAAAVTDVACHIELTWSNATSTGELYLEYPSAQTGNGALQLLRSHPGYAAKCRAVGAFPSKGGHQLPLPTGHKIVERHALQPDGSFVDSGVASGKLAAGKGKAGQARPLPFTLCLKGMPCNSDEQDIAAALPLPQQYKPVRVEIKRNAVMTNAAEDAEVYLSIVVSDKLELLPKCATPESVVSMEERKGKSGLFVFYSSPEECEAVAIAWEATDKR